MTDTVAVKTLHGRNHVTDGKYWHYRLFLCDNEKNPTTEKLDTSYSAVQTT